MIAQLKPCGLDLQGCAPFTRGTYFGDVCWEEGLIRHGPYYLKFETADEFLNYTPSIGGDLLLGRINTKDNHDQMAWHCHPKSQTERG